MSYLSLRLIHSQSCSWPVTPLSWELYVFIVFSTIILDSELTVGFHVSTGNIELAMLLVVLRIQVESEDFIFSTYQSLNQGHDL